MPEASRDRAVLREIVARLDSLNNIVQDLLVFARPREPKLAPVVLEQLLRDTAALLKKDPAHAATHVDITGTRCRHQRRPRAAQVVFLNLLLNAAQATRDDGHVRRRSSPRMTACAGSRFRTTARDPA